MTVTAVPLPPVKKSSLFVLWLGIAALLAGAAAFAWYTTPRIGFVVEKAGKGPNPKSSDVVLIKYKGTLKDGTVFDQQEQAALQVDRVVPGFTQALKQMQKGGRYKVTIPPKLGYGAQDNGPIPGNSTLIFTVELLEFKSQAEVRAMQQAQEAIMRQLQQQGEGQPKQQ